jgi:hypothetical protein
LIRRCVALLLLLGAMGEEPGILSTLTKKWYDFSWTSMG